MSNKNQSNNETFFNRNCFIKIENKIIYFNEIVDPEEFKHLYLTEKVLFKTFCKVNTKTLKPFLSIPTAECNKANIRQEDIIIIRISKENKSYELVSKIANWGKMYLPQKVINKLSIKNHEILPIEIINNPKEIREDINAISITRLFNNQKISIIKRANNFVTIHKTRCLPITLPNNIKLSPTLVEAFFLIHGDGHYKSKLFFVNNNEDLHDFVIKTFQDELRIPKSLWRGRINLNNSRNQEFAIKHWIKNTQLTLDQLYPSISRTKFNTSAQGNLRIAIDRLIVSQLFRKIFNFMKENLDEELSYHALNGLLAAEGGAQIDKIGLHRITLSYNKEEKELFIKILRNCQILQLFKDKDEGNKGTLIIEKWNNLYLFFEKFSSQNIIPFQLHNKRKKNAFQGMNNHSFTKTMYKYLTKLIQCDNSTVKDLAKNLKMRQDSCLTTIRKPQYSKFINIKGAGINRKPFIISITKQGKDLLNLISTIEQEAKIVEKQIFVKKEDEGEFGKDPNKRTTEELINYGIVNIDKPKGPTSHQTSDYVKKILKISKAGHSGTLEN